MKLIIDLIFKVSKSRIPTHLNKILGILSNVGFWSKLGKFLVELETKQEFLSDPKLSLVLASLCKFLMKSLERLPNLFSRIPFYQLQNVVLYLKEKANSTPISPDLDSLLNNVKEKYEQIKTGIREKVQSQVEPPDDFRSLSVFPTAEDVFKKKRPFLRENILKKPFSSVDHYLDIHFRLLKEEIL